MTTHDVFTALASLLLPPGWIFLLLAAGFVLMKLLRRRWGSQLLVLAFIVLWVGSTPVMSNWLMQLHVAGLKPFRTSAPAALSPLPKAVSDTAIVVLGLGAVSDGQEYGRLGLTGEGHERLRYGIYLARATGNAVLYTGGRLPAGGKIGDEPISSEAALAQKTAVDEFKYPLRWTETKGITVRDSAKYTADILRAQKIGKIILVAHAWKMPRALQEFRDAGFDVTVAPVDFPEDVPATLPTFFPTSEGVRWVRNVTRERFGMLRAKIRYDR